MKKILKILLIIVIVFVVLFGILFVGVINLFSGDSGYEAVIGQWEFTFINDDDEEEIIPVEIIKADRSVNGYTYCSFDIVEDGEYIYGYHVKYKDNKLIDVDDGNNSEIIIDFLLSEDGRLLTGKIIDKRIGLDEEFIGIKK